MKRKGGTGGEAGGTGAKGVGARRVELEERRGAQDEKREGRRCRGREDNGGNIGWEGWPVGNGPTGPYLGSMGFSNATGGWMMS